MVKTEQADDDNIFVIPDFQSRSIYVLPGVGYPSAIRMFTQAGLVRANSVEEADIVCFLGGTDVNPSLYNEKPCPETGSPDKVRDRAEEAVFHKAVQNNKVMFGICRGAQFLHVMNGGTLWQHVTNHAARPHDIIDIEEDKVITSSSLHHQMMKFNDKMEIIAVVDEDVTDIFKNGDLFICRKTRHPNDEEEYIELEVEACCYRETKSLCIQGHPEVGPPNFMAWSLTKLKQFVKESEQQQIAMAAVADQLA